MPLSEIVVDYILTRQTWDIQKQIQDPKLALNDWNIKAAQEITILDDTGSTLVTKSVSYDSNAWANWTPLRLKQPLWSGDSVVFNFEIPKRPKEFSENHRIHVGVCKENSYCDNKNDDVVFQTIGDETSVEHVGTLSAIRSHELDDYEISNEHFCLELNINWLTLNK